MNSLYWKILIALVLIYIIIKLYNFNKYLKRFLVPNEIQIIKDEIEREGQNLIFVVRFSKGFFKKTYFMTNGEMENKNPLNLNDLKKMLTLTEIKTFNSNSSYSEQDYFYIQESNPHGTSEYKVKFLTVENSVIDNLRNSERNVR